MGPRIRKIPLKIAAVIGLFGATLYIAEVVGSEELSSIPQAYFWAVVMFGTSGMAWFADWFPERARGLAVASSILFFVLALVSPSGTLFPLVYLLATAAAAYGWFGATAEEEAPVES